MSILLSCTYVGGDDGFYDYQVDILAGRRNRAGCSLVPHDASADSALARPPRICHILENGVHAHQYEVLTHTYGMSKQTKTRVLRLIEGVTMPNPLDEGRGEHQK
jgi:hypothetical protein